MQKIAIITLLSILIIFVLGCAIPNDINSLDANSLADKLPGNIADNIPWDEMMGNDPNNQNNNPDTDSGDGDSADIINNDGDNSDFGDVMIPGIDMEKMQEINEKIKLFDFDVGVICRANESDAVGYFHTIGSREEGTNDEGRFEGQISVCENDTMRAYSISHEATSLLGFCEPEYWTHGNRYCEGGHISKCTTIEGCLPFDTDCKAGKFKCTPVENLSIGWITLWAMGKAECEQSEIRSLVDNPSSWPTWPDCDKVEVNMTSTTCNICLNHECPDFPESYENLIKQVQDCSGKTETINWPLVG